MIRGPHSEQQTERIVAFRSVPSCAVCKWIENDWTWSHRKVKRSSPTKKSSSPTALATTPSPTAEQESGTTLSSALGCSVLVLNRFYMAIRIVNVRRAMTLLFRGCAEVITIEEGSYSNYDFDNWCEVSQLLSLEKQPDEDYIRAVNFEIQVPRIVRLTRYDKMPQSTVRFNRKNLFARDDHRCQYCGQHWPTNQLSLDHVMPRSLGGTTTWENIVCSCLKCNSRKGGRTPEQANMKLLTKPAKPRSSPAMSIPLDDPRYASWKTFVQNAVG